MARQGNRSKLPAKANAASKVVGSVAPTSEAGMIVTYQGEEQTLKLRDYGSFKKLIQAAVEMQKTDLHFEWSYYDSLPQP